MNSFQPEPRTKAILQAGRMNGNARAQVVNRTHRVVREKALDMREQRRRSRSLWAPVILCSSLLLVICYAAWGMLDLSDVAQTGVSDTSSQMLVFLVWSLPITAFLLGLVWVRRGRSQSDHSHT